MIQEIPARQYEASVTTTTGVTSNSLPFFYIEPPKITAIAPNAGPLTATSLILSGGNLATTTSVTFGDAGEGGTSNNAASPTETSQIGVQRPW